MAWKSYSIHLWSDSAGPTYRDGEGRMHCYLVVVTRMSLENSMTRSGALGIVSWRGPGENYGVCLPSSLGIYPCQITYVPPWLH